MKIKKLKSHSPKVHDNTDGDVILVPPSVLENKLEPFERYTRVIGTVGSDIALAFIFIIPILTGVDFKNFAGISGATIEGAFYVGVIVMLIKVCYNFYQIHIAPIKSRRDVIRKLLVENREK